MLIPTYFFLQKKKYIEQEDGVYAYQSGKNKYTLLTTFRTPRAAVYHRTRSQKERNQMDPNSTIQVACSVVPNRNPIQEALYRARLAVIWAKGQ